MSQTTPPQNRKPDDAPPLRSRPPKKKRRSRLRAFPIVVCAVAVVLISVLIFGTVIAFAVDSNTVSSGVLVGGHDMSGKTYDEVVSFLSELENPYTASSVTVKMNDSDRSVTITSQEIDLVVDTKKTAEAAVSYAKHNPIDALAAKFLKRDVGFIPSYDHLKLDSLLNTFAREVGGTLVQHGIEIKETEIVITPGKDGLGVNVPAVKELFIKTIKPSSHQTITAAKANTSPADIDTDELYETTKREAQDAKYTIENGKVVVADEINGREIDKKIAEKLLSSFNSDSKPITIPFIIKEASVKAGDLSTSLFADSLGKFSTRYMTSNVPRSANVELAARLINGKILLPGEEFSYNGAVGPRTAERGFKAASVYENNKMVDGLGGGICQTSSTLYGAVLYADLQVIERHEHSLEISYAPLGMDATVAYGSLDFRFKNNTDMPLKITSSWGGGTVSVNIIGTKKNKNRTVKINTDIVGTTPFGTTEIKDNTLPAGKKVEDSPGFKGHVVNTYKVIYENGVEVENKFLHKSTYTMVNRVMRVGTGPADAAPSPSGEEPNAPAVSAPPETPDVSSAPSANQGGTDSPSPTPPDGL